MRPFLHNLVGQFIIVNMTEVLVVISGKVQGVFFRASTQKKALELGLTGWVKNCSDGSVSALFQGEKRQVSTIIAWCQEGPEFAEVASVKIESSKDCTNRQEGFTILYE